jgi:hypothetical protein
MPRATPGQHALLQATLEDIARQVPWPPKSDSLIGPKKWWELIIAAYDRTQKHECELLPAIDGIGFNGEGMDFVRGARRRRNLNIAEIGEIIEYARAWGVDRGVVFREFKTEEEVPA